VARAEQSVAGLTRKLAARGYAKAEIQAVVEDLVERGLLSDRRFAESWLRQRLRRRKPASPHELELALRQRGISREISRAALAAILDSEAETSLLRRYLAALPPDRAGALRAAGFSAAAIEAAGG